jgi:predicted ATPase with chaperone activity
LADTGLDAGFITDLSLKLLYFQGQLTGAQQAEQMHLPFAILMPILEFMKREQLVEVTGTAGVGPGAYQYLITQKGSVRAREQLERTTYMGPAPVPWNDYVVGIRRQSERRIQLNPGILRNALSGMVLADLTLSQIGPAVNSGKSIFLYGPPGNGKSSIAENIGHTVLGKEMYIPYAVEVDGQIIIVYDQTNHTPVTEPNPESPSKRDGRWIRVRRPAVMVGGELTLDGLELRYDYNTKYYEAPFQMKANGGMFLIDDFGRQQVRPHDLLNRWIVPMEKRVDFLAMHTGRKIEVPFEVLLVFSTNLPPKDLVDEAFLRRIRQKIEIGSPTFDQYREIMRRVLEHYKIEYDEQAVRYLLQEHYIKNKRPLRANHPRDLVEQLMDISSYQGTPPQMTKETIDQAVASYFVDLS